MDVRLPLFSKKLSRLRLYKFFLQPKIDQSFHVDAAPMRQFFNVREQIWLDRDCNGYMKFNIRRVRIVEFGEVALVLEFAHFFRGVGFRNGVFICGHDESIQ